MNDRGYWRSKGQKQGKTDIDLLMGRIPPQDIEAEMAVLGAILLEKDAFPIAEGICTAQTFYEAKHALIFEAIKTLTDKGNPIDLLTVTDGLRAMGKLEEVGGVYHLAQLTNNVVSGAHVEYHCRIIHELYMKREAIRMGYELIQKGFDSSIDAFDLMDEAESSISKIGMSGTEVQFVNGAALARIVTDAMSSVKSGELLGISSGYEALDNLINGFQKQHVYIIAARPSVGKTAFAINCALNVMLQRIPVAIYSLETSVLKIGIRLTSAVSEVDNENISRAILTADEQKKLNEAAITISQLPIHLTDIAGMNIDKLRSSARILKKKHNIGMIVIDYLQLLEGTGREANREAVISGISRGIKKLAKELDIPIIALSQLNRESEKKGNKEPMLSDLRESGAIEQDADVVAFLSRPDYLQDPNNPIAEHLQDDAIIHIKKNKDGACDNIPMHFVKNIGKWFDKEQYNIRGFRSKNIPDPAPLRPYDNPSAGIPHYRQINWND